MYYIIYKITNNINNKIYIGKHKTRDINDNYFGSGTIISRAIKKYGIENFTKEILFNFETEQEMDQCESNIVNGDFVLREDTYNIKLGGNGGFDYINKHQLWKTKNWHDIIGKNGKIGAQSRIKKLKEDVEYRNSYSKKISDGLIKYYVENKHPFDGKHHTEESRNLMSVSMKGKNTGSNNGVFGKHWVTNGIESKMVDKSNIPINWWTGRHSKMPK